MITASIDGFAPTSALNTPSAAFEQRWHELPDGLLLRRAERDFDVLVTTDRSLPAQNVIAALDLAVVVLHGRSNRLADLVPLVPRLLTAIETAAPGSLTEVA